MPDKTRSSLLKAAAATLLLWTLAGCHSGVNKSFRVADGETAERGMTTVNGNIHVGREAEVDGDSRTVNGRITVKEGSRVGGLATVNGGIRVAEEVTVDGDLESINGAIESGRGTTVDGDIGSVNGRLDLEGTTVQGKLTTHNGSIELRGASRIGRDVVIERVHGTGRRRTLEIKILEGSVVEGDVVVKDRSREVTVYLAGGGEVLGEIRHAEVIRQ